MPTPVTTTTSVPTKAILRQSHHAQVERILNVTPKIVIAQAQINQSVFRYPLSSLTIDNKTGDWTKVKPGLMVLIGDAPGTFNVGVGVVRRLPGETLLYIDPKSKGDPGSPMGTRNIFRAIEDNFYITVIKFYPVFATLSRIANGVFFKQFDRSYNGELADLPPVANIGDWQAVTVNPVTGLAQFTLTSAASFAYQNKSIVGRTWDTDDLDIVDGTTTSEGITLEGPAGFYIVSCTVRDTTNQLHTARVYLWANATSGPYAPFSSAHGVTLGGIRQDRQGGEMTFTAAGEQASEIYPFQGVLYTERPLFDAAPAPDDAPTLFDHFCGYIEGYDIERTRHLKAYTYKVLSPIRRAQSLASVPQQLDETALPSTWAQIRLSNPITALDYLLRYHAPALLENHDFLTSGNFARLRRKSFVFQSEGLGTQIRFIMDVALSNIGSLAGGATLLVVDPLRLPAAEQDEIPLLWDWQESDYLAPVRYPVNVQAQAGYVLIYAFSYDGTTVGAWGAAAPGKIQGQSNNKPTLSSIIVPASRADYDAGQFGGLPYPQYRLMEVVGTEYALANREVPSIPLTLNRGLDIADPADLRAWHVIAIDDLITPVGNYPRALPTKVTRNYKIVNGVTIKQVQADFELEAFGQPGIPVDIERGGAWNYLNPDGWSIDIPTYYDPKFPEPEVDDEAMWTFFAAWNNAGAFARTFNILDKDVTWERIAGYQGRVRDACLFRYDGDEPLYAAFATWEEETRTARVYYIEGVDEVPFPEGQPGVPAVEIVINDETFDGRLRVCVKHEGGFNFAAGIAWKTSTGITIRRTLSNWIFDTVTTTIGTGTDGDAALDDFDLLLDTGRRFVVGGLYDDGIYRAYHAVGIGDFEEIVDLPSESGSLRRPPTVIKRHAATNIYMLLDVIATTPSAETINSGFGQVPTYANKLVGSSRSPDALEPNTDVIYGHNRIYVLPDASEGRASRLTNITYAHAITTAYPYYLASSPDWFPPAVLPNIPFQLTMICRNLGGEMVYTATQEFNSLDEPVNLTYLPSFLGGFDHIICSKAEVGFDIDFVEPIDVATIEFRLEAQEPQPGWFILDSEGGGGYFLRSLAPTVKVSYYTFTGATLSITRTHTVVDGPRLFLAQSYASDEPTFTDKTPEGEFVPLKRFALAVDPNNVSLLAMAGVDRNGVGRILVSDDGGGGWAQHRGSKYDGIRRYGECLLMWGFNALDFSDDRGETRHSRLGNWLQKVGAVGTIEGILVDDE